MKYFHILDVQEVSLLLNSDSLHKYGQGFSGIQYFFQFNDHDLFKKVITGSSPLLLSLTASPFACIK